METQWEKLPILDWELARKLAGNQMDLAKDMLAMLTSALPRDMHTINQLASQKKYPALQQQIHRLHGAVAYCGAPRLKQVLLRLDTEMKKNKLDDLTTLLKQLNAEVNSLLEAFQDE
jgi:two-component system sensor histidine kinase BarA